MKKRKVILLTIGLFLLIASIIGLVFYKNIQKNLDELKDLNIAEVDLSNVRDGVYNGNYEVFPIAVDVKVTIKNHIITNIEITRHQNGQGQAAEAILNKVIEGQTLKVDTIAGATYSSKVILKAVEKALSNTN